MTQEHIIATCEQYIANQQQEIVEIQNGEWDERITQWSAKGFRRDRQSLVVLRNENIEHARMAIEDAHRNEAIVCPECGKGRSKRARCWFCGYPQ